MDYLVMLSAFFPMHGFDFSFYQKNRTYTIFISELVVPAGGGPVVIYDDCFATTLAHND